MSARSRGEMDITTDFGSVIPGSSPGGSTKRRHGCAAFSVFDFLAATRARKAMPE